MDNFIFIVFQYHKTSAKNIWLLVETTMYGFNFDVSYTLSAFNFIYTTRLFFLDVDHGFHLDDVSIKQFTEAEKKSCLHKLIQR